MLIDFAFDARNLFPQTVNKLFVDAFNHNFSLLRCSHGHAVRRCVVHVVAEAEAQLQGIAQKPNKLQP